MTEILKTVPTKSTKVPQADNQAGIENHKKAASHLEQAAKHHLEAAGHHENENHEKAAKSTVIAQGHVTLANEAQKEDTKYHALKG
jgi:hypothetical protein